MADSENSLRLSCVTMTRCAKSTATTFHFRDDRHDLKAVLEQCDEGGRPSEELSRQLLDRGKLGVLSGIFYTSGQNLLELTLEEYRQLGGPQQLVLNEIVTKEIRDGVIVETRTRIYQPSVPDVKAD